MEDPDVRRLAYLQAVVKESLRLCPPAPFLFPRQAIEDCRVAGFRVPEGSQLMVNAWKLQRDPNVWGAEPEEFRPERFTDGGGHAAVDVKGMHHQLIPFGSGRRVCPGISFAMQVIPLVLARLLQGFQLEIPGGAAIDLSLARGTFEVLLTPRLDAAPYNTF